MTSTMQKESPKRGSCWTSPMDGWTNMLRIKHGRSAIFLRSETAQLPPRYSMRTGCIQSAINSQAFAPTALDCLLDLRLPARLMRRDPTASYSLRGLLIATNDRPQAQSTTDTRHPNSSGTRYIV